MLFSCTRKAGGFNNNPNAKQFAATFKKLMFLSGLSPNDHANISAQRDTSTAADSRSLDARCKRWSFSATKDFTMFNDEMIDHSYSSSVSKISPFIDNILVYITAWVVHSVTKYLKCGTCVPHVLDL